MSNGGQYFGIPYPKLAIAAFTFVFTILSAGVTMGVWYAVGQGRVLLLEQHTKIITYRVDTLESRVDSIVVGAVEPTRLLRALATLRCLDGTPSNLLNAADLPCDRLVRTSSTNPK
jgi:hypothetical protein